ncbi:carboxypeptidase regulatory-like domain-containing protein [Limnothrix sp. FACHB-881]|uniref:carboxypeptidase regulatory-like domain-containing protein n=1 Tax=Limnothrix sp. FACHB-881 TaxID=2692819 RepID=UPI00168414F7|nr:carboxypeptidase regulatory-like domain-containing protein [Limnothrix sp. FACHB-881]MBD2635765.1 carboxypeptidase regulatory-like domain-containing protein [Limnothrix sp. FACHB-881]
MQNFKDWPVFVKISFGVLLTAFVIAGLVEIPKLSSQPEATNDSSQNIPKKLVNIDIVIESESSTPLENVEIRFLFKGAPEVRRTNTDGFVQIEIPERTTVDITLSKEGFKTAQYTINLENDPNRTRVYRLRSQK